MDKIIDIVKQILLQLGANQTVFIQLGFFIIAITFLTVVVYSPYFKAADKRLEKTKGADAVAKDAAQEAKNLSLIYQNKAREINDKIKNIFDSDKAKAQKKAADILIQSKTKAEELTQKSRAEIAHQVQQAEAQIQNISNDIANVLKDKFEKGL